MSYYRNFFYFLKKHVPPRQQIPIAALLFFYRVLVEGRRQPLSIIRMTKMFAQAWLAERNGQKPSFMSEKHIAGE